MNFFEQFLSSLNVAKASAEDKASAKDVDREAAELLNGFDTSPYSQGSSAMQPLLEAPEAVRGAILVAAVASVGDATWFPQIGGKSMAAYNGNSAWCKLAERLLMTKMVLQEYHFAVLTRSLSKIHSGELSGDRIANYRDPKFLQFLTTQMKGRVTPRLAVLLDTLRDDLIGTRFRWFSGIDKAVRDIDALLGDQKPVVGVMRSFCDAFAKCQNDRDTVEALHVDARVRLDIGFMRLYGMDDEWSRYDETPKRLLDRQVFAMPSPEELDEIVNRVTALKPHPLTARLIAITCNLLHAQGTSPDDPMIEKLQAAADANAQWSVDRFVAGQTRRRRAIAAFDRFDTGSAMKLIDHFEAASGARPSAKWLRQLSVLVPQQLRSALSEMILDRIENGFFNLSYHDASEAEVKGLLWSSVLCDPERLCPALVRFALSVCFQTVPDVGIAFEKEGNACLWALINMPNGAGVPYLARMLTRVKYPKVKKKIEDALNEAAAAAGISRGELDELSIPTHGLDREGRREIVIGPGAALLTIDGTSQVNISWRGANGKISASIPAALKDCKDAIKQAKAVAKEIEADLSVQPQRLQRQWLENRSWPSAIWRERYLEHPLVGPLSRRLIWSVDSKGERTSGHWSDGAFRDVGGSPIDLEDAVISLWHPIGRTVEAVLAWRDRLQTLGVVQPFKQAHREVYLVTDAERRTGTYSNRFAGHIVKQHQLLALARLNGWRITHRIWADVPNDEPTHIILPQHGLMAEYWTEGAGGFDPEVAESQAYLYLTTDQLRFYRLTDPARALAATARGPERGELVRIDEVPALVLSEVMRHCDLFVGVASVANDPNWVDAGRDAAHPNQWHREIGATYWHEQAFGDLGTMAETRLSLLTSLLPSLELGKVCRIVEGKFLRVQGKRRAYKIHLGSGNILMEPNNQYLCIVPAGQSKTAPPVRLPFEGDNMLSIILAKAALLAADDKITDPTILRQIER